MWERTAYVAELGLSFDEEAMAGIAAAERFFERMGFGPAGAMFVGTAADDAGVPSYGTLWFFSDAHICTATDFRTPADATYSIRVRGPIAACTMTLEACDVDDPDPSARMRVEFMTETNLASGMRAHGRNCRQLLDVVQRYLVPPVR